MKPDFLKQLPRLVDVPAAQLASQPVILRLDLNYQGAGAEADFRLGRSLPTIRWLVERRAKVVVLSHVSAAVVGGDQGAPSLRPEFERLAQKLPARFWGGELGEAVNQVRSLPPGGILMLENLRRWPGEEADDPAFAAALAALGKYYVNDAFAASHRAHASIVGLPSLLPGFAGPLLVEEVSELSGLFEPAPPLVVIIGGNKLATKLPLIQNFLPVASQVFVYGALAHPFLKARGLEIGRSLLSEDGLAGVILPESPKIILPVDGLVGPDLVKDLGHIRPEEAILDAGPRSVAAIAGAVATAKTVLWNGPLGDLDKGFNRGTEELIRLLAGSRAYSVIGGGDTVPVISRMGYLNKFGFVSTGGGAMLSFLGAGTLPGLQALLNSKSV
jgi:phosphoglycerate kinase